MFKLENLLKGIFVGALLTVAPLVANATTVGALTYTAGTTNPLALDAMEEDGVAFSHPHAVNLISLGSVFTGEMQATGTTNGGAIAFYFEAQEDLTAVNFSTSNPLDPFVNLRISWCSGSTAVSPLACSGELAFITEPVDGGVSVNVNSGDTFSLVATWESIDNPFSPGTGNLDFFIAAVPVPAAGFLLLGALGGLGFAGRRRRKAA